MDLSKLRPISAADVAGKRVLVRADLNVPVADGKVSDATRLERILAGLKDLSARHARVIVISHFGRPKGGPDPTMSLAPVAAKLAELLGKPVQFVDACIGDAAEDAVSRLAPGEIAVLENLRFHKGEEKNDPDFVTALARSGDLFVNDAFSAAHRAHASTEGLARVLPAYAGPLMLEEIAALCAVLENPQRPTAALVGGAKVSSKIPILKHLAAK
ncbi:MAG: phosphoglycerate kinase, partial [Hyphomicrobium sp.]|nr:phosphoglycerate kinase [Hyphomicrobium sp.]